MTSLDEEHNPYAAPEAELQVQNAPSGPAVLYPMSPRKAAVMSALTMSLYDLVFWYRHWTRLKESGSNVSPIARTIFAPFAAFGFVTTLTSMRIPRDIESGSLLRMTPLVYLVAKFMGRVSDRLLVGVPNLVVMVLGCALGAWALATIQRSANEVLAADNYQGPSNSGATVGAVVGAGIGVLLWLVVIIGSLNPESFEHE